MIKETLEFYADEENHRAGDRFVLSTVDIDFGKKARQALEELERLYEPVDVESLVLEHCKYERDQYDETEIKTAVNDAVFSVITSLHKQGHLRSKPHE